MFSSRFQEFVFPGVSLAQAMLRHLESPQTCVHMVFCSNKICHNYFEILLREVELREVEGIHLVWI